MNLAFVVAEIVYGRLSGSLALVTDAFHNLGDVLGLGLAWGAVWLAQRRPTAKRTYGFRRSSILVAMINAALLLISVGAIAWEALGRLFVNETIDAKTVMIVAAIGILINGGTALLFMKGREKDINIRGAFAHLASDALIAAGVVVTGGAVLYTGFTWLDPAASIVIAGLITWGTWSLLRDSVNLALDAVPEGINMEAVKEYLANLPTCSNVHDLHVWGMSSTEAALTAHVVVDKERCDDEFLSKAADDLHHRFGIEHTTLQIEFGDPLNACGCEPV